MSYRIITDTGCDISPELLSEWGTGAISLSFRFTDEDRDYTEADMPITDFYNEMRKGRVAKTAAVNIESFKSAFRPILEAGDDLIYIGFSSGLSSTYNSGRMAADELSREFPDRKIYTVDSLCASAGQGLLVYLACEKQRSGADVDATFEYVKEMAPKVSHRFTVDDLVYLKRGGRVSAASAFFGNLLGIKPVLHVDDEGKLVPVNKVRGRRTSLLDIVKAYGATAKNTAEGPVFISHADCMADVEFVVAELKRQYGVDVNVITNVGAVIGAHSGPGTFALFFIAKER